MEYNIIIFPGFYSETHLPIGHVRYINILTWLRGFRVKIVNVLSFFCLSITKRDSNTKKTTPNIEVWPESLVAMLEYWYIERGLLDEEKGRFNSNTVEPLHNRYHTETEESGRCGGRGVVGM